MESSIISVKNFKVMLNDQTAYFWKLYPTWELDTFIVFDKYANLEKNILDIGCWIGRYYFIQCFGINMCGQWMVIVSGPGMYIEY